jgi:hypothetical protein
MEEWDEHGRWVVSEGSGLEEYVEQASGECWYVVGIGTHSHLLTINIYCRYAKWSCRCGDHNAYLSQLGVLNDGGIQPRYHCRIDGFQLRFHSLRCLPIGPTDGEVAHSRFYRFGSESGNSEKSICNNERKTQPQSTTKAKGSWENMHKKLAQKEKLDKPSSLEKWQADGVGV